MRLVDLDAQFIGAYHDKGYRRLDAIEGAQGIVFQCPKCAEGKPRAEGGGIQGAHYVVCWFRNPRGAAPVPPDAQPGPGRWWVEGTGLDDLSFVAGDPPLPNSVLLKGGCNWHGYVTKGDAK